MHMVLMVRNNDSFFSMIDHLFIWKKNESTQNFRFRFFENQNFNEYNANMNRLQWFGVDARDLTMAMTSMPA